MADFTFLQITDFIKDRTFQFSYKLESCIISGEIFDDRMQLEENQANLNNDIFNRAEANANHLQSPSILNMQVATTQTDVREAMNQSIQERDNSEEGLNQKMKKIVVIAILYIAILSINTIIHGKQEQTKIQCTQKESSLNGTYASIIQQHAQAQNLQKNHTVQTQKQLLRVQCPNEKSFIQYLLGLIIPIISSATILLIVYVVFKQQKQAFKTLISSIQQLWQILVARIRIQKQRIKRKLRQFYEEYQRTMMQASRQIEERNRRIRAGLPVESDWNFLCCCQCD